MKAAVLREVNLPLEVEEVQVDAPGPREVLIRTRASGVCHSDLHFVEGKYSIQMPAVLGHEAAGTVEKDTLNKSLNASAFTPSFLQRQEPETLWTEVPAFAGTTGQERREGVNTQVTDLFRGSLNP